MKAGFKMFVAVGVLLLTGVAGSTLAEEARSGKEVYTSSCTVCHDSGAAGAPKLGDAASWGDRLEKDKETLYKNAINGIRAMPPMGTCMGCSEQEIRNAVDYMISESQ